MAIRLNTADHNLLSSNSMCITCESNDLGEIFTSSNRKLLTDKFNLFHQNIHSFNCNYGKVTALLDSISKNVDALVFFQNKFQTKSMIYIESKHILMHPNLFAKQLKLCDVTWFWLSIKSWMLTKNELIKFDLNKVNNDLILYGIQ